MDNARRVGLGVLTIALVVAAWLPAAGDTEAIPRIRPVGVWDLKGKDQEGRRWIATAVLLAGEDGNLHGHIDWISKMGNSGREYVVGTYVARSRVLTLRGTRVEYADQVVRGSYRASLSRDGSKLEKGKWSSLDPNVPGSWTAQRIPVK